MENNINMQPHPFILFQLKDNLNEEIKIYENQINTLFTFLNNNKLTNRINNSNPNFYAFSYLSSIFLLKSNDDFQIEDKNIEYIQLNQSKNASS
jgi:hypothetical protein